MNLLQLPLFCAIILLNNTLGCSYWHELVNFCSIEICVLIPAALKNMVYLPGQL